METAEPNFSLKGKIALVTGAGRGIGLAIATAFASAGAHVAIQDLDLDVAEKQVHELKAKGIRALALGGDVSDLPVVQPLVEQTVEALGGLHILVNNAAIQGNAPWETLGAGEVERQYRANVIAPLLLCQKAAPVFRKQQWGRIINVGSIQQLRGTPSMLAYSMSKAALWNLTTGLAVDLGKDQVTVNLIAPGYFDTYRNRKQFQTEDDRARAGRHMPLGRIGFPSDCAGVALLLASDAGAYITGQRIHVDGGMSVR